MMLQAIHFEKAQDITNFIDRLVTSDAIEIDKKKSRISIKKTNYLLQASDDNVYFLDDIRRYIEVASDEDIAASTLTIVTKGNLRVTLAQLKADKRLIDTLSPPLNIWEFIQQWNVNCYSDFSALERMRTDDDIHQAKMTYDNHKWHDVVTFNKTSSSLAIRSHIANEELRFQMMLAPTDKTLFSNLFVMSTMHKDFLTVTLLQESKIKQHLLNATKFTEGKFAKEALREWIEAIERHNITARDVLQVMIKACDEISKMVEDANAKYAGSCRTPMALKREKQVRDALARDIKALQKSISRQEFVGNKISSIAVYGLICVGFLLMVTAVPMAFIVNPFAGILVLGAVVAIVAWSDKVANGLMLMKNAIERKKDAFLDGKYEKISTLKKQYQEYSLLNWCDPTKQVLTALKEKREAYQSALNKITKFDDQLTTPIQAVSLTRIQSTPVVSGVSMFQSASSDSMSASPSIDGSPSPRW